jgi:acyl-CoA synthetase (AMP-forming)/AMP-acid ligase II
VSAAPTSVDLRNLRDLLSEQARVQPYATAYVYLPEGEGDGDDITYAELHDRAGAMAAGLCGSLDQHGRVLLLFPPGLDFVASLFACFYAGVVAVSAAPPLPKRLERTLPRLLRIAEDADVQAVLTTEAFRTAAEPLMGGEHQLGRVPWMTTDELSAGDPAEAERIVDPGDVAVLQYTSGSTGSPRGVMLTHHNLLVNTRLIASSLAHTSESRLYHWLPPYHDLGLIGGILQPSYLGICGYLASPLSFIKRPRRWLEAVTRFGITTSGAPNFAYDLCVDRIPPAEREGLDLSSWTVAFNAAEPVREATIARFCEAFGPVGFRKSAFLPAYGLAEATLMVTGCDRLAPPTVRAFDADALRRGDAIVDESGGSRPSTRLVGCGAAVEGHAVRIVDPESLRPCPAGRIGELWVSGPSVAPGYWRQPEVTAETFEATISGEPEAGPFLRSGDLGMFDGGELFVVGRRKEVLIFNGVNYQPHELEVVAEEREPRLRSHSSAAFEIEDGRGAHLVLAVELEEECDDPDQLSALARTVRQAIADESSLQLEALVVLRGGTLPKTTSGKIQRRLCKKLLESGRLEVMWAWTANAGAAAVAAQSPFLANLVRPGEPRT